MRGLIRLRRAVFLALALLLLAAPETWAQPSLTPKSYGVTANVPGYGLGDQAGSLWQPQYHANWNVVQSQVLYNPTEWQIYTSAANGIVQVIAGTNQVVLVSGVPFSSTWIGLPYFYFNGSGFMVASVSGNTLTVQTTGGGAVSWGATATGTYYFAVTSVTNTCNVSGTAVTYVSGQPFISLFDSFYVNGTAHAATYGSQTTMTLGASLGTLTNATCIEYKNITGGNGAGELSNMRLQGLAGSSEENFVITETPAAAVIQTSYAGQGQYRPILIMNGEQPAGTGQIMAGFYPNATLGQPGYITLGGGTDRNNEVLAIQPNASNVDFWFMQGATIGLAPSLACRGTDATVGCEIDVQGANTTTFSSHNFGNTEFQVFGVGGTSWLGVGSSASDAPMLSANGADAAISINLSPKGAGVIQVGGVAGVSCAAGSVSLTTLVVTKGIVTHC